MPYGCSENGTCGEDCPEAWRHGCEFDEFAGLLDEADDEQDDAANREHVRGEQSWVERSCRLRDYQKRKDLCKDRNEDESVSEFEAGESFASSKDDGADADEAYCCADPLDFGRVVAQDECCAYCC